MVNFQFPAQVDHLSHRVMAVHVFLFFKLAASTYIINIPVLQPYWQNLFFSSVLSVFVWM